MGKGDQEKRRKKERDRKRKKGIVETEGQREKSRLAYIEKIG